MNLAASQALDRTQHLLEAVTERTPTARIERLRERYLASDWTASIDRDLIEVRSLMTTEGEPMVLRRAKAFAAIVREKPIEIFDDELIVGWFDYSPFSCALAVKSDPNLARNLETMTTRERNPVSISEADRRALVDEIIPYWRGDGSWSRTRASAVYDDPLLADLRDIMFVDGAERPNGLLDNRPMRGSHVGHTIANHEKVLAKGFLGIKREAEDRLDRLDRYDPDELAKIPFLTGVIIAMEAAAELGARFAARARELATTAAGDRKTELLAVADVCDRVPSGPATTFHEALQLIWFVHILHWWETRETAAISPGRVDQYLHRFYVGDLEKGILTPDRAQELIDAYLLRFSRFRYFASSDPSGILTDALYGAAHHMDVGGYDGDGNDATNDLTYLFIEGMMHTRMQEPNFGVLVHSKTPEKVLIKASQLCALGTGHPMFLNHDTIINNLLGRGDLGGPPVTLELARKAGAMGCNEPCIQGMDSGFVVGVSASTLTAFNLTLRNGVSEAHGRRLGLETGDPRSFATFDEFTEAFKRQLVWLMERAAAANNIMEPQMAAMGSTVFQSALLDDCIENGVCREAGGARYNFGPFMSIVGSADIGDSLAAIKKCVYEDRSVTWDVLLEAIEHNFEGFDGVRRKLLDVPKFGNDDDYADEQTVWVKRLFAEETVKHRNTRGGHRIPCEIPLAGYVTYGERTPALPSGKFEGQALSDSIGPTEGSDANGPTAVLKSVSKIDNARMFAGQTLNMRLEHSMFDDDSGVQHLAAFVRTFTDLHLHHVQFNVVSSDVLRAAQADPASHKDLLVRVAGYVARFTELPMSVQDSIIARTEHGL